MSKNEKNAKSKIEEVDRVYTVTCSTVFSRERIFASGSGNSPGQAGINCKEKLLTNWVMKTLTH